MHKDKRELKGTNVLKYIYWGELKEYDQRSTCRSRKRWYSLPAPRNGKIAWSMIHAYRHVVFYNKFGCQLDHNFFEILPKKKRYTTILLAQLVSTISMLTKELFGRQYGGGSGPIKTEGIDIEKLLVIDPEKIPTKMKQKVRQAFDVLARRPIQVVFDEVKQTDRQKLDSIFFDILGLTKKERQQVYDAVCELVSNRLKKAKTFGKKNANKKEEFNPSSYADHILEEVFLTQEEKEFPRDFINPSWETFTIQLPKIEPKGKLTIEEFFGKASLRIDGETIDCQTTPKANFVELAIEKGVRDEVCVPADDKNCIKAVREYLNYHKIIQMQIEDTMKMFNLTKKQTRAVLSEIENRY